MDTATHDALLNAIFADPDADLPRLVYADFLEENGQAERAEFIRIQCEPGYVLGARNPSDKLGRSETTREHHLQRNLLPGLRHVGWDGEGDNQVVCYTPSEYWPRVPFRIDVIFRRGFIDTIHCPFGWWCGKTCETCRGNGFIAYHSEGECPDCGKPGVIGTGRSGPAAGLDLMRRHPIRSVSMSDRRPVQIGGVFNWMANGPEPESPYFIRRDVWEQIELPPVYDFPDSKYHTDQDLAIVAMNEASCRWARGQNGH